MKLILPYLLGNQDIWKICNLKFKIGNFGHFYDKDQEYL